MSEKRQRTASFGQQAPVIDESQTYEEVSSLITKIVTDRPQSKKWWLGFAISFVLTMVLFWGIAVLLINGPGIWGINIPVAWGFAITNFVWWIGIGHAGTLISAILLLLHQEWRTSINRFAEAMTLFAVACAGLWPLLHLGRPWLFYWIIPYPDTMNMWPQFRSPLVWDFFAVSTYATVSLIFWYMGMVPDLATVRDRATRKTQRIVFGIMALGWRGASRHWHRYEKGYLILAGLATPLVLSVHSVVSFDFTIAIVPGWHSTIFPPYFVAGAIFSGFAMVLTLSIPLRKFYHLEKVLTIRHLDNSAKLMLATGLIVAYGYLNEHFLAWYGNDKYDIYMDLNRIVGPYAAGWWVLMFCNVIAPQILWWKRFRRNVPLLFVISLIVNVGMWTERFVIVVTSLHRDYLPSSWGMFWPTFWDWAMLIGSLGLFTALFFLFVRFLPQSSMSEMRKLIAEKRGIVEES
ncbi:MAG: NrfD/PsrC family molybdoenzyme membrane anchor subunit [Thermoanaerobaculia bacterium]